MTCLHRVARILAEHERPNVSSRRRCAACDAPVEPRIAVTFAKAMTRCNHPSAGPLGVPLHQIVRTCHDCGASVRPAIAVTFEIITPESAADGDVAERGWDTDPDGDPVEWDPDDAEIAIATSAVDAAVQLINHAGGVEPSSSHWHRGVWYTEIDARQDRAFFERGEERRRSFHLRGFTDFEEREIFARLTASRFRVQP